MVVIYEKRSFTPLLSARYYFDKKIISGYLAGDASERPCIDLDKYKEGEIFLSDRLSGNMSSTLYRNYRDYIFFEFYKEIYCRNKNCKFILMARHERFEKLLTKYLRIGLELVGSVKLRGKDHWVVLGDLKKIRQMHKQNTFSGIILLTKIAFATKK